MSKVITNSTLANATLYIWNSTGAEINSSNVQILSGNSANTSINHTFLEDGDANNNFTWNVLVTDVDNLNSFQVVNNKSIDETRRYQSHCDNCISH